MAEVLERKYLPVEARKITEQKRYRCYSDKLSFLSLTKPRLYSLFPGVFRILLKFVNPAPLPISVDE